MAALGAGIEPVIATVVAQPLSFPAKSRVPVARSQQTQKDDLPNDTLAVLLLGILIAIIIFIVIISFYDVVKERLVVKYTEKLSRDPQYVKSEKKALKMNLEAEASYGVVLTFSIIAIIIAIITLPIIFYAYHRIGCGHSD